jgi:hypothetical protein
MGSFFSMALVCTRLIALWWNCLSLRVEWNTKMHFMAMDTKWIQSIFSDIGVRESISLGSRECLPGEKMLQNYFEEGYRPEHSQKVT